MKKTIAYTLLGLGFVSIAYISFLLVKRVGEAYIDSKTVTFEEAMAIFEKQKK